MEITFRDLQSNKRKDSFRIERLNLCSYSATNANQRENPRQLISPDLIFELKVIAQQMGGDLGLEVTIGNPGEGSFFSFEPPSITLDPLHVIADPDNAKFVAGHEGAHRRFSPSPFSFWNKAKALELFQRPGFQATVNALEDCAVNDGMCRELPGLKKYTTSYYEKADREGFQVSTPEIQQITLQIGRTPKFAIALAEIMRDWHRWRKEGGYDADFEKLAKEGRYSTGLEKSIIKSLRSTKSACRKVIATMPASAERNRELIEQLGKERVEIIDRSVYPEILKLLEEDISQEAIRKSLSDNSKSDKENQDTIRPSDSTSREIKQAIDEFLAEKSKKALEESREINNELESELENQQQIQEQLEQLKNTKSKNSQAKENDLKSKLEKSELKSKELKKQLDQSLPDGHSADELNDKNAESSLTQAYKKDLKKLIEKQKLQPLPFDKLSDKAQKELEDKFAKLPEAKKNEMLEQAAKELGKYEHEFIKALESKTEPDKIETIYEMQLSEELAEKESDNFDSQLKNQQKILEELEEARKENLNQFESVFEEVADEVNKASNRLQRILIPEASLQWKRDQMVGSKLNLQRAQQSEVDPRFITKLFEQRLNPIRRTHAFEILVDSSGSMEEGGKMEHAFMGCVFASALCEGLNVEFEILEFSNRTTTKKSWADSIRSSSVKENISRLASSSGGNTYDAPAIELAFKRLTEKDAMYKFIFVLTDADSSISGELQRVLNQIQKQSDETGKPIVVVHFGIGAATADRNGYYRHSFGNLKPEKFFTKFCEVIEEVILSPEEFFKRR